MIATTRRASGSSAVFVGADKGSRFKMVQSIRAQSNSILLVQASSNNPLRMEQRPGIATIAIVIVIIVIVVVAGAATYSLAVATSTSTSSAGQSSVKSSISTGSSRQTSTAGTATSATTITSFSISSTAGSSSLKTYTATFNFSLPLGPSGELTFSNNDTVKVYRSAQSASGSFTFFINPANYSGSGSGQGTMTVTTTGFCSGKTTFPYTFKIPDATDILGGNITVFMGDPTPANFTVPLTCTATPSPGSATGDTFPFLSTYPNEISVAAVPVTVIQHLAGNISYAFTITPVS